jgi:hypothetical protein
MDEYTADTSEADGSRGQKRGQLTASADTFGQAMEGFAGERFSAKEWVDFWRPGCSHGGTEKEPPRVSIRGQAGDTSGVFASD